MNNQEAIMRLRECIEDCTSGEDDVYKEAFGAAIVSLETQQADMWVSVSERLPDENGYYLIQQECMMEYMRVARYTTESQKFRTAEVKCYYEDVIAWQPLPKPWKEEQ
jgi:hypothetical protein